MAIESYDILYALKDVSVQPDHGEGHIKSPDELRVGMRVIKCYGKKDVTKIGWTIIEGPKPMMDFIPENDKFRNIYFEDGKPTYLGESLAIKVKYDVTYTTWNGISLEYLSDCGVTPYKGGGWNKNNYLLRAEGKG